MANYTQANILHVSVSFGPYFRHFPCYLSKADYHVGYIGPTNPSISHLTKNAWSSTNDVIPERDDSPIKKYL